MTLSFTAGHVNITPTCSPIPLAGYGGRSVSRHAGIADDLEANAVIARQTAIDT